MNLRKIKEVFPDWKTTGAIFAALQNFSVPWVDSNISNLLDLDYIGNKSGNKIISSLVESIVSETQPATQAETIIFANIIFSLYGEKWSRLWELQTIEYNPIQNYNMVENMRGDEKITAYGKVNTHVDDMDYTKTGTETTTPDTETTADSSIYGFNSENAVPTNHDTKTETGTNEIEYDVAETNDNTITDTQSGRDVETRNYQLSRSGNIGVTTTQQMLQSEIDLWKIWDFFKMVVYPDIDRVLTIETY